MKTVIIPNDYHPFVIEVNGVKYTYPEGTEQSVPDEVASAIHNYYKLQPREGDPNPVPFGVDADGKEEYKSKYTGAEIDAAVAKADTVPAVTEADAGKALVVDDDGKIVTGEAGGNIVGYEYEDMGGEPLGYGIIDHIQEGEKIFVPVEVYSENGIITGIQYSSFNYITPGEIPGTEIKNSVPQCQNDTRDMVDIMDTTTSTVEHSMHFGIAANDPYDGTTLYFSDHKPIILKVSTADFDSILSSSLTVSRPSSGQAGFPLDKGIVLSDGTRKIFLNALEPNTETPTNFSGIYADTTKIYFVMCAVNYQQRKFVFTTQSFTP